MSSHKTKSILGSQDIADMKNFTWSKVLDELSLNAPNSSFVATILHIPT